ncbi:MAG: hypothetical protein IJV71_01830 [Lachnospiraceae bacterium]|nr:hypothetical protein [Lachnospiraceae bacterium]
MATTNNKQVKYRKGAVVRFADTPESIAKLEKLGYKVDEGKKSATVNKDDKKTAAENEDKKTTADKDDKKESNKSAATEK